MAPLGFIGVVSYDRIYCQRVDNTMYITLRYIDYISLASIVFRHGNDISYVLIAQMSEPLYYEFQAASHYHPSEPAAISIWLTIR